jgi:hypothetical protein
MVVFEKNLISTVRKWSNSFFSHFDRPQMVVLARSANGRFQRVHIFVVLRLLQSLCVCGGARAWRLRRGSHHPRPWHSGVPREQSSVIWRGFHPRARSCFGLAVWRLGPGCAPGGFPRLVRWPRLDCSGSACCRLRGFESSFGSLALAGIHWLSLAFLESYSHYVSIRLLALLEFRLVF